MNRLANRAIALALAATGGAVLLVDLVHRPAVTGLAGPPFWLATVLLWIVTTLCAQTLASLEPRSPTLRRLAALAVPLVFGALLLVLWELVTVGAGVPGVLMPPPSAVAMRFVAELPTLGADVVQTFFKGALAGFALGSLVGFATAILADRVQFLRRGIIPIGNFTSALPIVGIAPIMVMWFGFDWPSKAAVVALMTFFPMLVNTDAGLVEAGALERDLLSTYASGYASTLLRLRLPAALPFIFTGLKINATLALIGAIVAEFFGTPTVGMGFRISIEASRLSLDMVWAEIALAALVGSTFYGLVALIERVATGWHPSIRSS